MRERLRYLLAGLLLVSLSVPAAYAQYGYHFGRNKIQYENFDWQVLKTENFEIFYYPEMKELAEHGAFFAEEAYEELVHRFDLSLNERVPLIFYSSNIHFRQTNVIPQFIPEGVGGFFEFLKGRVVVPAHGNLHRFRRVIRHELVHVFTYAKILNVVRDHRQNPDRFLPLWFTEGIAEHWSGDPDHQYEMVLRDAVFSNYLVPLHDIFRVSGSFLMYKQGEAICRFISQEYGDERLLMLMENFWKDSDFRRILEITLQEEYRDIARKWEEWLHEQYYPEFGDLEVPSLIARGVAGRGFSAKPEFYRFADGRRKVFFLANQTGYTNLYQVSVDSTYTPTGDPQILVRGERDVQYESFSLFESRISVSNDGKLAFVTQSGGRDAIHTYDLDAGEAGPSYTFDDLIAIQSPSWNPEGNRLSFSSIGRSGFSDLYVYDIESRALRKLTNDSYDDRDPSWSPDGRYIAFTSDRTQYGREYAYNVFVYDLEEDRIRYITKGPQHDFSPSWSPDGQHIVYTSSSRDEEGRYSAQNVWIAPIHTAAETPAPVVTADLSLAGGSSSSGFDGSAYHAPAQRELTQLTNLTSAVFDPVWTEDGNMVFTTFEHMRFAIRQISDVDERLETPYLVKRSDVSPAAGHEQWAFNRIEGHESDVSRMNYRRRYDLDIAQGQVNQNPLWGTSGGGFVSFTDMLGDDRWFVALYNTATGNRDFVRSINAAVSRLQLHRRANIGYGAYRLAGLRYDITDPDAFASYPVLWETMYGGYAAVGYPISQFRRIEVNTSLNWSDKEVLFADVERRALLLSNMVSLVHDNSLYGMNGPIEGWRANLTAAYTTDVMYSNVNYFTVSADVRHYWRIGRQFTLASWGMARMNEGREARLFVLGGSWDLRGFPLFGVRGRKMWFTSHEFRFPILNAPSAYVPVLAPFGIANLRGALFFDAAHAWNDEYDRREPQINTGETVGAAGLGFRLNLFGGFVLRYDLGYRLTDNFNDAQWFRQFFFGWDF